MYAMSNNYMDVYSVHVFQLDALGLIIMAYTRDKTGTCGHDVHSQRDLMYL